MVDVKQLDVSPLVPEARQVVAAVAQVYWRHTQPWLVGLLVHGSALKGGFIPGGSDIDFHLYLDDAAFDARHSPPFEMAAAVQRDLAQIAIAPFHSIQCFVRPTGYTLPGQEDWVPPIPGAYHVVLGRLPIAPATPGQVRAAARRSLETLDPVPFYIGRNLFDYAPGRLARFVRLLATAVWPTLYHVLVCQAADPLAPWRLPKTEAIALLPEDEALSAEIREFHARLRAYYQAGQPDAAGLAVLEQGVRFLRMAQAWYHAYEWPLGGM